MKVSVSAQSLVQELRLLNHIIPNKPALPILSSVFVHADQNHLVFYTTDLEIGFRTYCQASIAEGGTLMLPAKRLLDLTEQLMPDTEVQISSQSGQVFLTAGGFRSRLQTHPPDDFPDIADEPEAETLSLPTTALLGLIRQVRYAISDKTKHLVPGALMQMTDKTLAMVATDGKRLSLATAPRPKGESFSVIIPTQTLDALTALFADGIMSVSNTEKHLFFQSSNHLLISRKLETEYPKYESIIPRNTDKHLVVNRAELAASLRRVGLLSEDNRAIILSIDGGKPVTLSTSSHDAGDASEEVVAKYEGPEMKMCTSWRHLLDFLETATSPFVTLDCTTPAMPLLLGDGADFINVVLLMRMS
jgi:DNA polymerase-3 subunit beta